MTTYPSIKPAYPVLWPRVIIGYAATASDASAVMNNAGVPREIAGSSRYGVELLDTEAFGPAWQAKFTILR
jgi:hypothetical protein